MRYLLSTLALLCVVTLMSVTVLAQESESAEADQTPKSDAAESTGTPSVERVMRELHEQSQDEQMVEPAQAPDKVNEDIRVGRPGVQLTTDPAVLGVAPGQDQPKLRAEGEFIVNRAGRLTRSPNGSQAVFAFEADSKESPEPPMILLPCAMLENMEEWVEQHGDKIVFIISGQVTSYRGTNFLLPTMAKTAINRGNLKP